MPDADGKLLESDRDLIISAMREKGIKLTPCPFCGVPEWTIGEVVVTPIGINAAKNSIQFDLPSYPIIPVVSPCGYTIFFSLVVLGVFPFQSATP